MRGQGIRARVGIAAHFRRIDVTDQQRRMSRKIPSVPQIVRRLPTSAERSVPGFSRYRHSQPRQVERDRKKEGDVMDVVNRIQEPNDGYGYDASGAEDILALQALDVPDDESGFIGNSCTSSGGQCCNNDVE